MALCITDSSHSQIIAQWDLTRSQGKEGGLRLEEVDSSNSGLSGISEYSHPERWTRLWHQYFLGTIGAGVAIGDLNGDRLPDLFVVGKDSANCLYINQGELRFSEESQTRGILPHTGIGAGVSLVDVDNDGDLDIYVTYTGYPNELYVNDGAGSFVEAAGSLGLAIKTGSNAPAFCDYDRDGDMDLYLQCNFLQDSGYADGMPDMLFENRDGFFVDISESAGISGRAQGHAAIWWDYNDDGWPDLYVANDFEPPDKLYRNNKDGTFADVLNEVLTTSPYSAMGADTGDIDGDGSIDILVAEMAARDAEKHQRTVANIETKSIFAPRYASSQYMQNMLSVKIGESQFAEVSRLAGLYASDWTWAARIVDLDNDGLQDVLFTNGMIRAFHDGDLGVVSSKAQTGWQRIAYFKNAPSYEERNLLFRNLGELRFEEVGEKAGFGRMGISFSAAVSDLDLDGDLDIALTGLNEAPTLYRNVSSGRNSLSIELEGVSSNRYGIGARARLFAGSQVFVRELVLHRGYLSSDDPVLHFGTGPFEKFDRLEIDWPSGCAQTIRDLEAGFRYRIRESDTDGEKEEKFEPLFQVADIQIPDDVVFLEETYRLYPKKMLLPENESRKGPAFAVDDFNGDGYGDVFVGASSGQESFLLLNQQGRRFSKVEDKALEDTFDREIVDVAVSDATPNGSRLLYLSSGGIELEEDDQYYRDQILSVDEKGVWEKTEWSSDLPSEPTTVAVFMDCDGDGVDDLIRAGGTRHGRYPDHYDNSVFKGSGGSFELDERSAFAKSFKRSGKTNDLLAIDLNGDGRRDLVQAVEWGPPRVWLHHPSEGLVPFEAFEDPEQLRGFWSSIAAGDFDGDGLVDLVIGNRGTNVRYVPTVAEPLALFSPKDENTVGRYIECFTSGGRLLPVESRALHQAQFPGLLERTTSSISDYARKDVFEIFGSEALEAFQQQKATESRTLLFLQREGGRFVARPLPVWAQSGAVQDLLVADYDEDGNADLFLSLEPRAPRLWVDRPIRGHIVLLKGRGGGTFQTILPRESGLEVDGYPRQMAWADFDRDGRSELLLAMNDGPLLVFSLR